MKKYQKIIIISTATLAVLLIGSALAYSHVRSKPSSAAAPLRSVSHAELTRSDGKDGHACLVAVDGMVYKIQDYALWKDGRHTSSKGLAYCGADLSKVIDKAPHGRSKLNVLIKVGPLTPEPDSSLILSVPIVD